MREGEKGERRREGARKGEIGKRIDGREKDRKERERG